MVSLKAEWRDQSYNKSKVLNLHTKCIPVPAKYYRLIIPHHVQLSATIENPTTYTENPHCHGEVHTTCGKLHNCGKFNNIRRKQCHCIALQTSIMVHRAFILKGMEGVQFWYIQLQYKPSFTSSSNQTLILPKYTTMVHVMEYTECRKIPCPNFVRFKCSAINLDTQQRLMCVLNLLTPNVNYSGHTAPLTSKVAFYIYIQQI